MHQVHDRSAEEHELFSLLFLRNYLLGITAPASHLTYEALLHSEPDAYQPFRVGFAVFPLPPAARTHPDLVRTLQHALSRQLIALTQHFPTGDTLDTLIADLWSGSVTADGVLRQLAWRFSNQAEMPATSFRSSESLSAGLRHAPQAEAGFLFALFSWMHGEPPDSTDPEPSSARARAFLKMCTGSTFIIPTKYTFVSGACDSICCILMCVLFQIKFLELGSYTSFVSRHRYCAPTLIFFSAEKRLFQRPCLLRYHRHPYWPMAERASLS